MDAPLVIARGLRFDYGQVHDDTPVIVTHWTPCVRLVSGPVVPASAVQPLGPLPVRYPDV